MKNLIITIVIAISILGCSKNIEGEVFLTDKKGASEKISLAKLYQIDNSQVVDIAKMVDVSGGVLIVNLKEALIKIDAKKIEALVARMGNAKNIGNLMMARCVAARGHMAYCVNDVTEMVKIQMSAEEEIMKDFNAATKSIDIFTGSVESEIQLISKNIDAYGAAKGVKIDKTNADGKYNIKISSDSINLFAIPSQDNLSAKYIWLIDGGKIADKLTLSNDNIYGSNCKECFNFIIDKKITKVIFDIRDIRECKNSVGKKYGCSIEEFASKLKNGVEYYSKI